MGRRGLRWAIGAGWAAFAAGAVAATVPGPPDLLPERLSVETGRLRSVSVQLDNDSLATWPHDDRWYTSGLVAHWVREAGGEGPSQRLADAWCARAGCGEGVRVYRLVSLVHAIWTPTDTKRLVPQPHDRPYGAWLSLGVGLLLSEPGMATRLDARLGMVGPGALGESVQNGVHAALGLDEARGWGFQLRPRPTLQLGWARLVRHGRPTGRADWVHRTAIDAGTERVQASLGAMLRIGAPPEAPGWPGEPSIDWGGATGGAGRWYLFAGGDLRATARDRTIDGPVYGGVPSVVRPEPFGGDLFAGAALRFARDWALELTMTLRRVDFDGPAPPAYLSQRFGSLTLRWSAP